MRHRSPIIFWLLLAATLSVDAVAVCWFFYPSVSVARNVLLLALAFSQISVVSIASIFVECRASFLLCAPFVAALGAAALMSFTAGDTDLKFNIGAIVIF